MGGVPRSLIAKKISTIRISGFSNKKALFPGMENPTFTRKEQSTNKENKDPVTSDVPSTTEESN
jgi:hypothetical protein